MLYDKITNKYVIAQQNAGDARQIIMLYDGVIKIINQARNAIEDNQIQIRYNLLEKAAAIINGLQTAINFELGGDIAKILDNYYSSIYAKIMLVQVNNDINLLIKVREEIITMRDSWLEVEKKTANGSFLENNTINDIDNNPNGSSGGLTLNI
jgi:flagellar protein FliS